MNQDRALQRLCISAINPEILPSFTVTRTLSYLSERQMTLSHHYNASPTTAKCSKCANRGHLLFWYDDC